MGAGDTRTIDVSLAKAFRLSFNLSFLDDSETVMHLANEAG